MILVSINSELLGAEFPRLIPEKNSKNYSSARGVATAKHCPCSSSLQGAEPVSRWRERYGRIGREQEEEKEEEEQEGNEEDKEGHARPRMLFFFIIP